jgi:endoplasmic reticulum chaperone BiP
VLSTSGDTHLGGEDFDHRVMDYFIKLVKRKYKVDISTDNRALQKLRREVERAKRALSSQHQVRVEIESLAEGVDLSEPLTRARFEELNADLFKKTIGPVRKVGARATPHAMSTPCRSVCPLPNQPAPHPSRCAR